METDRFYEIRGFPPKEMNYLYHLAHEERAPWGRGCHLCMDAVRAIGVMFGWGDE